MTSILRSIVAGPRARHPEAGLDLCYVTDFLVATSGPGASYPQVAYRNPLKDLVKFLDAKHGKEWAIWEFRAEGTGYPDEEVYGRIRHYPWPDHHPPPFALIPLIMGSMRNWLKDPEAQGKGRVVVVHCKAGKGRSGTVCASYLISEEGWEPEEAKQRFTERRMRPGFGAGISIPSQVRWIGYVDRWTKNGKLYVERPVEVLEVHVWGLRDGVKICVEGFVEEGKVIKKFHTFQSSEREIVRGSISRGGGLTDAAMEIAGRKKKTDPITRRSTAPLEQPETDGATGSPRGPVERVDSDALTEGGDVVFRPSSRVVMPSSDVNIDFERRNKSKYGGFTVVTSVAHVWFNAYFEGKGPELDGKADDSGVFEIEWDAMDGIKGSSRKGTRAFDKLGVVWRAVDLGDRKSSIFINEPAEGEDVRDTGPADWRQDTVEQSRDSERKLGLRAATTESAAVSRANSVRSLRSDGPTNSVHDEIHGVKPFGLQGEDGLHHVDGKLDTYAGFLPLAQSEPAPTNDDTQPQVDGTMRGLESGMKHPPTGDLPDGKPGAQMTDGNRAPVGSFHKAWKNQDTIS